MKKHRIGRTRVGGFTLLELVIVLAITAIGIVWAAQRKKEELENNLAVASGDNIEVLGQSLANYISNNTAVLAGAASTAVTVANLQGATACGTTYCLSPTFGPMPWMGGYTTLVRRIGGAAPYQFEALACTNNAWTISGTTRGDLVGTAVKRVGGPAGMTYDAVSGAVGSSGAWAVTVANYPATNAAGRLCYYVSQSVNTLDQLYLRTDGTNKMNAALQMNGNAIAGATTINATGTATVGAVTTGGAVTAGSVSTSGAVSATGNVTSGGTVQGTNVTATSTVTGAQLTSTGNINIGSGGILQSTGRMHIQAGENLYLQPWSNASGSPTIVGGGGGSGNLTVINDLNVSHNANVTNDVTISSLTSRANAPATTSVSALLPTLVEVNSVAITADGQAIAVPSCPSGGAPRIFAFPQTVRGPVNAGNWGADIHIAGPLGGPWTSYARDSAGAPLTAGPTLALARIFCAY